MSPRWRSARHCHAALKALLGKLRDKFGFVASGKPVSLWSCESTEYSGHDNSHQSHDVQVGTPRGAKRRRVADAAESEHLNTTSAPNLPESMVNENISSAQSWAPVLEYTGPDFGFDAAQFGSAGGTEAFLDQGTNFDISDLFGDAGSSGFTQGLSSLFDI
jgi:hypothetical protein